MRLAREHIARISKLSFTGGGSAVMNAVSTHLWWAGKTCPFPSLITNNPFWWYIQTMEHYSVLKFRNELLSHGKTSSKLKCISLSERSPSEKSRDYMTFWKRQKYGDSENISGCQEVEGTEGWIGRAQGILGQWTALRDIILDICHYTFIQTHKNEHHQEWSLMWTMDFGWQWIVNVGSSVVTMFHSGGGMLVMGEAMCGIR